MSKTTKTRLKTAAIAITTLATVLSMSGVAYLAPVAHAIADGDLIRVTGTNDIFIVKLIGAKKFKRLILNPTIFESYGHLTWDSVQDVSQATVDEYTNTNLVIEVNADGSVADPKVYAVTSAADSDVGERRWLDVTAAEFEAAGLDWDSLYNINATEASPDFYPTQTALVATDDIATWSTNVLGVTTVVTVASGLSVALASDTPAARVAAKGAVDVIFGKYNLTAGSSGAVKINEITVARSGLSTLDDFGTLKLYKDSVSVENRVGAAINLNTTTHTARFTGLNWTVNAGTTAVLLVTASIQNDSSVGVGNLMNLGISAASNIVLDGGETVSGAFPLVGNYVSPAAVAVGQLDVQVPGNPATSSPISGSTDQHVGDILFDATTENFRVRSVKVTNTGSAIPADLSNFKLKYLGNEIATMSALGTANTGTFTFTDADDWNLIKTTTNKTFGIYVDVAGGINVTRTIIMSIQQAADVSAQGVQSGGYVTVTRGAAGSDGAVFTADVGATHSISQGSLTNSVSSSYNPSADTVVIGTESRIGAAWRFSAGSTEGVRVTAMTVTATFTNSMVASDLGTVSLAEIAEDGSVGATIIEGTVSGTTVVFGVNEINSFDTDYLFDVEKGKNKDIYFVFSVPAGVTVGSKTVGFGLAATAGNIKADGLSSLNDLSAITPTATTGSVFTLSSVGTFAYATTGTPAADTIVPGATDVDFAHWAFTTSGEAILVSSLAILAEEADGDAIDGSDDIANVELYKESVSSENLLASQATVSAGVVSLSFSDTVPASTTRTYILIADVLSGTAGETQVRFTMDEATDVTSSGVSSGADITGPSIHLDSNWMTIGRGTLGVIASGIPVYTNVTQLSSDVEVARFVFTVGTAEDVKLNLVRVRLAGYQEQADNLSIAPAGLTSFKLYNVATGAQVGTTVGALTSGKATFSGLDITIPKDGQITLGVKVTIGSITSGETRNIIMGIDDYYGDVAATGLDSAKAVYANQLVTSGDVLATLFAASAVDDTDLTGNITDADDELSGYGVTTLGISAVADNDIIQIESEDIYVTTAADGTVVRNGFFGSTAAAHSTTGVPIILKVGANSSGAVDAQTATTLNHGSTDVTGIYSTGQLVAVYDPDVATQEDDLGLITAIDSVGSDLTIVDSYDLHGAAITPAEASTGDEVSVQATHYGQAQIIQEVGTLTLSVSASTPAVGQAVAGSTDVEYSRFTLVSQYENINFRKATLTRSGGRNTDFSCIYLQNLADATWGPLGTGKSNCGTIVSTSVIFNFTDTPMIVDYTDTNGIDFAVKANLNTTAAGVTSTDAPKFLLPTLNSTNFSAKGASTGTTLSSYSGGTPAATTAGNLNAQVIYKGKLDVALNSTSPSGKLVRNSAQDILKLDFSSDASGSVATFRAATQQSADGAATLWAAAASTPNLVLQSNETTIKYQGTGSLRLAPESTTVTNAQVAYYGITAGLLSTNARVSFWLRWHDGVGATALGASDLRFVTNVDATTAADQGTALTTAYAEDLWYYVDIAIPSGTDASDDFFGIEITDATTVFDGGTANYLYVDDFRFYLDKIRVGVSGVDLLDSDDDSNTVVNLKDGSTVVATGYFAATTPSTIVTVGTIDFIPTTQFTIPSGGKTLTLSTDTTGNADGKLFDGTDEEYNFSVDLGSADSAGSITAGQVWWYDDAAAATIKWVDSAISPIQSGTLDYDA